jgi:hypothetical protein
MALARTRSHKHFQLDARKLKRAQRVLRAMESPRFSEQLTLSTRSGAVVSIIFFHDLQSICDALTNARRAT